MKKKVYDDFLEDYIEIYGDVTEWLEESREIPISEETKSLNIAFENYKKKFGNLDITTFGMGNTEEIIKKINRSIKLGIPFDDLYVGNIKNEEEL